KLSPTWLASYQCSNAICSGFWPTPAAPAGPVAPVGPCGPCGPVGPTAPGSPCGPVGPTGPCATVASIVSALPLGTIELFVPATRSTAPDRPLTVDTTGPSK